MKKKYISFIIIFLFILPFYADSNDNDSGLNTSEIEKKIKIYVNKLNSTSQVTEQSFGKNQLIKMGKTAIPYLHQYIRTDKRVYVRVQIAFILGKIGDSSSIEVLKQASLTKYSALTKASILALGEIGGKKVINTLKELKKSINDNNIKKIISDTIKKVKKK